MKSTKTKIQCKPCKTFITEKNYPNHLKSHTKDITEYNYNNS